jgi:hypothetical protein
VGEPAATPIACATYTHARRHPLVLGRIGGWAPPFQLTITQLGTIAATDLLLVWTWRLWATPLPDTFAALVAVGAPVGAGWAVRRLRVEGRSLARAGLGRLALWCAPTAGVVGGRPHRDRRPWSWAGTRSYLAGE